MSSPKPTVVTSPAVTDKHSPSPVGDVARPPTKSPSPAPPPPAADATPAVEPAAVKEDTSKLEDLETELELDLENMKLDNIDTTVC